MNCSCQRPKLDAEWPHQVTCSEGRHCPLSPSPVSSSALLPLRRSGEEDLEIKCRVHTKKGALAPHGPKVVIIAEP